MNVRRVALVQLIVNVILALITIVFLLGQLVGVKYLFEDPAAANEDQAFTVNYLYATVGQFAVLLFVIIVFNMVMSVILRVALRKQQMV